jgi:hypothetical protein
MLKLRQIGSKDKCFSGFIGLFITVFIIVFYPTLTVGQNSIQLDTGWVMQTGDNQTWADPDIDDSKWQAIKVGVPWEKAGYADYDGYAWYRIEFTVPEQWQQQDKHGLLSLSLGSIDDADVTYFNGEQVGATGSMPPDYKTTYCT